MGQVQDLKAARQAFPKATLNQKRRRAQQNDSQRHAGSGVGVPKTLYGLGPAADLLNLIQHQ